MIYMKTLKPRSTRSPGNPKSAKAAKVSRWGNSLGFRISKEAADRLQLCDGATVNVFIGTDSLTIRPVRTRKKWTEAELLKGVTPETAGGEIDWGDPVGKEVW